MSRYIIETKNQALITKFKEANDVEIIDAYEPMERLTIKLEKLHQAFNEFADNEASWNIMRYYLKGRGYNLNEIDSILDGVSEFLGLVKAIDDNV